MVMLNRNIFFILSITLLASGCGKKETDQDQAVQSVKISMQEVTVSQQAQSLEYSGTIEADNTVSIGFSVPGRVDAVMVQEGQHVVKGQLLAAIEQNTYKNNLTVAGAGLEQAKDNFSRLDQLYKKGSLPERDYIAAKTALAQAQANKETALKNLNDTRLYASFSGIITRKLTEAGATAAPGIPAFTIVKTDKVYAVASINENEISALRIGAQAKITIPSLNKNIDARVAIINPQADDFSKTYNVKIRLDNPGGILLPGMIADISINSGKSQNAVIIPAQAVVRDHDNINYVFTAKADNTAFKKRVIISKMTGSNEVVVTEGLQAGEKLIVKGQTNLQDGTPVKF
ncbi:efflux RND transporter periplasmic adaptor subunit [Flavobacterium pectinovorum]|uniref:efflux RND transporter periplasmic adaptor subunit n=1 Tax=Flavobacterium pectinovorum TaxID=29533 RepID=UPI001FACC55D|nr:efflux RND transporter periplasmic adaptor subunit [Flavobacterium pectinovorum]MCI9845577.1 efflux RND transporter periplasmic adaptor subunit [Flavobacterium pectinovorum]